jgi:outer membrane protein, heavy metal efflux system
MKTFWVSYFLAGIYASPLFAAEPMATNAIVISPAFVETLAEEARTNRPALLAANARADAAGWNTAAVRTWDDPMAKLGVMGAERTRRADDGDLLYGVEQKLPLFGKPQAARAVAQSETTMRRHEAYFLSLQFRRDLTLQLFKKALAERFVALSRDDLGALELLTTSTEERYRNGVASQFEVLQAQNERSRRVNRLRSEESLLRAERSMLNRLLNRPDESPWPPLLLPKAVSNMPPIERLIEHATQMAPQLDIMRASVRQAESAIALARKQRLPDVSVGVEGRQYADTGEFREGVVMFGVSLPWGNRSRYAADIKRETLRAEAAQLDLADMQLSMREDVTRHVILSGNARREADLYRTEIIPRSEKAAVVSRENWLNGRGTLRDVIEARRMLIDAQMTEARALAEHHSFLAELALHCGSEIINDFTRGTNAVAPIQGTP